MTQVRAAAALVFAACAALYMLSVHNGFAYDDNAVIRADPRVHGFDRIGELFSRPYWADAELGLYRPLVSLSYAIDWSLSGGSAAWFHFVNVIWNATAAALVVFFLGAFVPVIIAALGGLLFAAHPVHVEAVANVVGRAELMAGVFSLAALVLWVRADEASPLPARSMAAVTILYALALMSKESAIMLPAMLVLADAARGVLTPHTIRAWLVRHARVLPALVATATTYMVVRTLVLGGLAPSRLDPALEFAAGPVERLLTALQAWPIFVRLLVFPFTLLADYGPRIIMPATGPTPAAIAGALIVASLVIGGGYAWLHGRGRLAAGLLFLPVTMLPTANLIVPIGVVVAERTLYLPSLAVIMLAAFAAHPAWPRTGHRRAIIAAAVVVITLFSARTLVRIPEWRSTAAIFEALRRDRPDSFRAEWHNARLAVERDMTSTALERYTHAVELWPYRRGLVTEAATYAMRNGDPALAARLVQPALERWPDDVALLTLRARLPIAEDPR